MQKKITLYTLFFEFFSKFGVLTWKSLNMKVVCYMKLYNFSFGQKFSWAMVWKLFLKHVGKDLNYFIMSSDHSKIWIWLFLQKILNIT